MAATYRYREVEAAVAIALGVPQSDAMRYQIRQLRKLGLPDLPTPGTGRLVEYSWRHALEIALGLIFRTCQEPRNAVVLAESVLRQSPHQLGSKAAKLGDHFVVLYPFLERPMATHVFGHERLHPFLQSVEGYGEGHERPAIAPIVALTVINISGIARRLADALERVAES